jgi:hypothetical protein
LGKSSSGSRSSSNVIKMGNCCSVIMRYCNYYYFYFHRNKLVEEEKRVRKGNKKITDYLVPRRTSNRKTQEAIREEKHQLLIKMIVDETEDGLEVGNGNDD